MAGECELPECLKAKLELLRACLTEFAKSDGLVRYRKYAKMHRTRNDGTPYTEVEFVYVRESRAEFVATMLSAIEAYLEHRCGHHWFVQQRKLLVEKLKHAEPVGADVEDGMDYSDMPELVDASCTPSESLLRALLSHDHPQHLTITDHDAIAFTDFAAKVIPALHQL